MEKGALPIQDNFKQPSLKRAALNECNLPLLNPLKDLIIDYLTGWFPVQVINCSQIGGVHVTQDLKYLFIGEEVMQFQDGYYKTIESDGNNTEQKNKQLAMHADNKHSQQAENDKSFVLLTIHNMASVFTIDRDITKNRLKIMRSADTITTQAISNDGKWIAMGSSENIEIWQYGKDGYRHFMKIPSTPLNPGDLKFNFSWDGSYFAVVLNQEVSVFKRNNNNYQIIYQLKLSKQSVKKVTSVALSKNGNLLCIGYSSGTLGIFKLGNNTYEQIQEISAYNKRSIDAIAIASDESFIASCCEPLKKAGSILRIWQRVKDVYKKNQIDRADSKPIKSLNFSPQGKYLVAVFNDSNESQYTVKTWQYTDSPYETIEIKDLEEIE
jgi:hypothetical protein